MSTRHNPELSGQTSRLKRPNLYLSLCLVLNLFARGVGQLNLPSESAGLGKTTQDAERNAREPKALGGLINFLGGFRIKPQEFNRVGLFRPTEHGHGH